MLTSSVVSVATEVLNRFWIKKKWRNVVVYCATAGAYDNRIVMWDVGGVDTNYNFKVK